MKLSDYDLEVLVYYKVATQNERLDVRDSSDVSY